MSSVIPPTEQKEEGFVNDRFIKAPQQALNYIAAKQTAATHLASLGFPPEIIAYDQTRYINEARRALGLPTSAAPAEHEQIQEWSSQIKDMAQNRADPALQKIPILQEHIGFRVLTPKIGDDVYKKPLVVALPQKLFPSLRASSACAFYTSTFNWVVFPSHQLYSDGTATPNSCKENEEKKETTLNHEAAHALDDAMGRPSINNQAFIAAYQKDIAADLIKQKSFAPRFSPFEVSPASTEEIKKEIEKTLDSHQLPKSHGGSHKDMGVAQGEGFAELVADHATHGANGRTSRLMPESYKVISGLMAQLDRYLAMFPERSVIAQKMSGPKAATTLQAQQGIKP